MSLRLTSLKSLALAALACSAVPAFAATGGSSSAYDAGATLGVANGMPILLGAINPVSGTAPPDYNNSSTVASYTLDTNLSGVGAPGDKLDVSTMTLTSMASGSMTSAMGQATINDLSATLTSAATTLFSLTATTVQSTSSATTGGVTGDAFLQNVVLSGSAVSGLNLTIPTNPTPNDVIFNAGGLTVILDAQSINGDSITTDAVEALFSNFPIGATTITGSLTLAQSEASLPSGMITGGGGVPEPWAWVEMLAGVSLVGAVLRRRRLAATA